jgi:hypothetical protein
LVSPNPEDAGGWINQQAWIHYVDIEENQTISYQPKLAGNGI